jgi:hypothetical protein
MTSKISLMTTLKLAALAGVAGLALAAAAPVLAQPGTAGGAPIFDAPKGAPNLSGKWINATPQIALKTVAGTLPPLNAAGKAEYAKHKADKAKDPINECLLQGEPRLLYTKHPFLIMQYGKHVDFLHEVNHTFRITYFDEKLDPDTDPTWLGHPTAKWEGKTLVIYSNVYNDLTWLDYSGLPHGTKLETEEHYTLSADGKSIKGTVKITDPDFYTKPWTTAFTLVKQPGFSLIQRSCMADHVM